LPAFETERLEDVVEADLSELIALGYRERRTLDLKATLPGTAPADATEFLYDVSSFANAAGGHLVFGLGERDGVPVELLGIETTRVDTGLSRLQSLMQDGIDPRISGVDVWPVPSASGDVAAIIVRIPKSPQLPHMVVHRGHNKFYGRNSNGKYPLRASELRALFLSSAQAAQQIVQFREERLSLIYSGNAPVPLVAEGRFRCVVHLVPLASFADGGRYPRCATSTRFRCRYSFSERVQLVASTTPTAMSGTSMLGETKLPLCTSRSSTAAR
jgi:hypothetical protein